MYTVRQINVIVAFRSFLGSHLRRVGLAVICACEVEAGRTVLHSVEVYVQYCVLGYQYCRAIPIAKDIASTRRAVYV